MSGWRNTAKLLGLGGVEFGAGHYPLFILLHTLWLGSVAWVALQGIPPNWWILSTFLVLVPVRLWVMASLGPRWTTRIITLPGSARVVSGPYRLCRHPNYLVVAAEIAILPLTFGAWRIALVFSMVNAALTLWRIREEEAALALSARSKL